MLSGAGASGTANILLDESGAAIIRCPAVEPQVAEVFQLKFYGSDCEWPARLDHLTRLTLRPVNPTSTHNARQKPGQCGCAAHN
jgi:hypothetical protein